MYNIELSQGSCINYDLYLLSIHSHNYNQCTCYYLTMMSFIGVSKTSVARFITGASLPEPQYDLFCSPSAMVALKWSNSWLRESIAILRPGIKMERLYYIMLQGEDMYPCSRSVPVCHVITL